MDIETTRFGKITVPEAQTIEFDRGLIGFEGRRRFALIRTQEHEPFQWLQSLDDGALAFVMLDPALLEPAYRSDIRADALPGVWAGSAEDLLVLAIATIGEKPEEATVNLLGPVVINSATRKAAQIVLYGDRWQTRHPVFPREEIAAKAA